MLIDRHVPTADFATVHELDVRASRAEIAPLVERLDLSGSAVTRLLFALRGMPRDALCMDGLLRAGFRVLDHAPGEELVLGIIGRPWRWWERPRRFEPPEFAGFAEPGYIKGAWNVSLVPLAVGVTRLRTETRVACTDDTAVRAFRRYWRLIRPFSGLIRMAMLRGIRARAESAARVERSGHADPGEVPPPGG